MKTIQETYESAIDDFRQEITEMTIKAFNDNNKSLAEPIVFALMIKDKEINLAVLAGLGPLFASPEGKDKAAEVIKSFGKTTKPIAIGFACEGYASTYPLDELGDRPDQIHNIGKPQHPKKIKKEMLFVSVETHNKECSEFLEIVRDTSNVKLVPAMKSDWTQKSESNIKGRFSDLLQNNYSEFARMIEDKLKDNLN